MDAPTLLRTDPGFFVDFWSEPGYAGAENALDSSVIEEKTHAERAHRARLRRPGTSNAGVGRMMAVAGAGGADVPMAIVVDGINAPIRMIGELHFTSGRRRPPAVLHRHRG